MREQRLLERIRMYELDPDRRDSTDPMAIVKSILHHIQMILNTKQGGVLIDEHYGVPDFTDIAGSYASDAVQEIEREINEIIRKYEPRLGSAHVEFEEQQDDVLALRFRIKGKLSVENQELPVIFESVVQADGKITVTE